MKLRNLIFIIIVFPLIAYRPFYSTDADVEEKGKVEIELGAFILESYRGEKSLTSPFLVVNIGIGKRIEIVSELKEVHTLSKGKIVRSNLEDLNLFLKGVLQGKEGISLAIEGGFLLPTLQGQSTGLEVIGIASGKIKKFVWHFNAGAFVERENNQPGYLTGFILELPFYTNTRLVFELTYEKPKDEIGEKTFLLGIIYEINDLALDLAFRKGIDEEFFAITAGVTFGF